MARIIRLKKEHIDQCYEALQEQAESRLPDGMVELKRVFLVKDRTARVLFTPSAWLKMTMLLDHFEKEVGWYGVASRLGEEDNDEYLIEDIAIYPQEVTAATVEMADPPDMDKWRRDHIEDERYDRLFAHGHSHVRMGTTPSGTDLDHQREILKQMQEDGFYIFMIFNKRLERTMRIYDLKKNIQFEDKDITLGFWSEGQDYETFIKDADTLVKDHVYKPKYPPPAPAKSAPPAPAKTAPPVPTKPTAPAAPATPAVQAKNAAPVQGMGWRGKGNSQFWNYDDERDEYYDPSIGQWIDGDTYRWLARGGYYD